MNLPHHHNVSDGFIKTLLVSKNPDDQDRGLVWLDAKKRRRTCGYLRRISDRRVWNLHGEDIAEIWERIMSEIEGKVRDGRFKRNGNLDGLVYRIACYRAIDFLRRRLPRIDRLDSDLVPFVLDDDLDREPPIEFECLLRDYAKALAKEKKLSKTETLVFEHWVNLLLTYKDEPSNAEIMIFVNEERTANNEKALSLEAVKAAKHRAFKKLRGDHDRDWQETDHLDKNFEERDRLDEGREYSDHVSRKGDQSD